MESKDKKQIPREKNIIPTSIAHYLKIFIAYFKKFYIIVLNKPALVFLFFILCILITLIVNNTFRNEVKNKNYKNTVGIPNPKERNLEKNVVNQPYVNEELGVYLPNIRDWSNPKRINYGKRIELNWGNFSVTGGYYYDNQGKLMTYLDVARSHLEPGINKEPQLITVDGYKAAHLIVQNTDLPHPNYSPYEVISIQKEDMVYELYIHNPSNPNILNQTASGFHFLEKNKLSKVPLITKVPVRNEVRVFFPMENKTIKSTQPTFIGKLRQSTLIFLDTNFGINPIPYNPDEKRYYLSFKSGRIKNAKFFIDNQPVDNVFGFAQYPIVGCDTVHTNSNGSTYVDENYYGRSRNVEPFLTEKECIERKSNEMPPVIFIFKPDFQLSEGKHIFSLVTSSGFKSSSVFFVNKKFSLENQKVPVTPDPSNQYQSQLDDADNCVSGYYYDKKYLHVPLPMFNNPNLLYNLAFPKISSEKGFTESREVKIKFENYMFDLHFPQSSLFYFTDEQKYPKPQSEYALFLPTENLYYSDGTKANVLYNKKSWDAEYFELFPIDISGRVYRGHSIPWSTNVSSGCDG